MILNKKFSIISFILFLIGATVISEFNLTLSYFVLYLGLLHVIYTFIFRKLYISWRILGIVLYFIGLSFAVILQSRIFLLIFGIFMFIYILLSPKAE